MKSKVMLFLVIGMFFGAGNLFAAEITTVLREGTPVILRLTEEVSTSTKNVNDLINFEVARDVLVDGKVVIKAGTPAEGMVNVCKRPAIVGQEGAIGFVVTSTKAVDNQWVSLRANLSRTGENKEILSAGAAYVCCPIFGLIKGTPACFPMGSEIKAYTENDLKVKLNS